MNREQLIEIVREQMPEKRWQHTLGVMETSVRLAEQYGADPAKAELAAILHDYCKYWQVDEQAEVVRESGRDLEVLEYDKQLWHAPAAAWIAEETFQIEDEDILNAIRYHTSGRPNMSLLEKIVGLADYIEPGRDFPGVERLRELAATSLDEALLAGFEGTIRVLLDQRKIVYPLTLLTRNDLVAKLNM
ncbi:bis(5'-nucleosyl)-tetraphosphatase (symmetrical) YqeK [Paenibacillus sp. N1-5-1-14]|uniref:bis(5'-nucleosyl)-tetraphosphatase (symmetrical) YqeK n=1 Tax=Paenibacillus radicibacter TaxID=2972488 RepID=UPI00215943D0|nr:bis(5'-nucleosyl)-tetraphosphatase (symmetrical) YqeK [Paenibacillus radicibacter]MCR8645732.1 bis(5'-nucleosyl)-tetraphosphatase (symmetrical) YqeK [Paenibacillus radicibacter]